MMNFSQLSEKISDKGFRRCTSARTIYDEDGNTIKVYDFEHRKKLDMFSVYLDDTGLVLYAEYTKVDFNQQTKKFSQQVTKLSTDKQFEKFLG
jgi:hypothetical protein